jgi:hypothetical protein
MSRGRLGSVFVGLVAAFAGCGDVAVDIVSAPAEPARGGASSTPPTGADAGRECTAHEQCPPPDCVAPACDRVDRVLCHPATGRCVECVNDGHCEDPDERCSSVLGECAVACATPLDCPRDEAVCDEVVGFCVECATDEDCEEDELCRSSECMR